MKVGTKYAGVVIAIFMAVSCLMLTATAPAQDLPAPGTTIDKSNISKYSELFPEEFLSAFEDGFGGLLAPIHVNVVPTKPRSMLKAYLDYSMKNKGKYTLDAEGYPSPNYNRDGLPFPDLKPGDPDFATKLMWNFEVRYMYDESFATDAGFNFQKRKGENLQWMKSNGTDVRFKNRMDLNPKPNMENPSGVYYAFLFRYLAPVSVKNTMTLTYRYADPRKLDDTWLYLPSMRRVIRAEAGQRSTPMVGSVNSLDDFNAFDGRIPEFTYTLVREQKILAITASATDPKSLGEPGNLKELPFDYNGYEVRDVYVIDITPKDSKYPQSKKRIFIDKDTLSPYYAIAYDRANKLWKIFNLSYKEYKLPSGAGTTLAMKDYFCVDVQFGMATNWVSDFRVNENNFTMDDVTPAAMMKLGR